jgi:hypothetical protein
VCVAARRRDRVVIFGSLARSKPKKPRVRLRYVRFELYDVRASRVLPPPLCAHLNIVYIISAPSAVCVRVHVEKSPRGAASTGRETSAKSVWRRFAARFRISLRRTENEGRLEAKLFGIYLIADRCTEGF